MSSSNDGYYSTVNPFENYDSRRTSRFPDTDAVEGSGGTGTRLIPDQRTDPKYPRLYNALTRRPDELFVSGGFVSEDLGAYVAALDPDTFEELWRTHIYIPDHWNYPGVAAVLADGNIYAIAGNRLASVHDGHSHEIVLPQHDGQGGAAYNGFVVNPDGVLFTKSMERGQPCEQNGLAQNLGLVCAMYHNIPSFLVAVDTTKSYLPIVAQVETPEFIMSRISTERRDGIDYIYLPGITKLWRYTFQAKGDGYAFERDLSWGPFDYVGTGMPGPAASILNDWVIIPNNGFMSQKEPFTIWAINIHDSSKTHKLMPLPAYPQCQIGSKPAVDPENSRVYLSDFYAGLALGLDFDPVSGFSKRWEQPQVMLSFWAVIGPPDNRQIVGTDYVTSGTESGQPEDQVVWRDADTGTEIARSGAADSHYNAQSVCPGFDGKFYYMGLPSNTLVELDTAMPQRQHD
ncbi:MAG: hypothetical protein JWM87_4490 [Candidatus Eremiobacteraeota bacterium]|nr:hypothetical protein [Candidatus Eremiobacteraeota bacterium]